METSKEILKTKEAAEHTSLSKPTLDRLRITGEGPVFIKIGRAVRYRKADLDAWLEAKLTRSTSERSAA